MSCRYLTGTTLRAFAALAAVVLVVGLVGCGSDEGASDDSGQESSDGAEGSNDCEQLEEPTPVEEVDSCERDDGCRTYGGPRLDVDHIVDSEQSCSELRSEEMSSVKDGEGRYCLRAEWFSDASDAPHLAGGYDDQREEWNIYVLPDGPADPEALGFVSCNEIPEEGSEAKEACLDCDGGWDTL